MITCIVIFNAKDLKGHQLCAALRALALKTQDHSEFAKVMLFAQKDSKEMFHLHLSFPNKKGYEDYLSSQYLRDFEENAQTLLQSSPLHISVTEIPLVDENANFSLMGS